MQVGRWGNSLAVRLPAELVKALELKEGDEVEIEVAAPGSLRIARDRTREEAQARLNALARPLPDGYRFDREEANERGR